MSPELVRWLASCAGDPLAFVLGAFPWGEPNTRLAQFHGPEPWQSEILRRIRDGLPLSKAIQLATASGHGVGKSALVAWIIIWAMATKPDTRGVVTANTETQLKTKTWAELGKWFHMFIGKEHFKLTATALFADDEVHERTWRVDMVPWSERNTEAFAGLHNQGRRIIVIFDEASAIPDIIWETTEGALTDANTEIIWCVFGNPTRNTGRFKECFPGGLHSKAWRTYQVDSREISFTNHQQIKEWIEREGSDDTDFIRIRVRGVFPRTGEMEFISSEIVGGAALREATAFPHEAFIIGVDVARYGDNETVICMRKGRDARTWPPIRLRGADVLTVAGKVNEVSALYNADAIFVDGGGIGGGVVDCLRSLSVHCFDVNFGGKSDCAATALSTEGMLFANKRAEMWGAMREWLKNGAIPNDPDLRSQLVGPTYTFNLKSEILLEKKEDMRKRGLESPDYADALALTFAYPIQMHLGAGGQLAQQQKNLTDYDPIARFEEEIGHNREDSWRAA